MAMTMAERIRRPVYGEAVAARDEKYTSSNHATSDIATSQKILPIEFITESYS